MSTGIQVTEQFVAALNEKFPVVKSYDEKFGIIPGRKFDKIVNIPANSDNARGVFAFVERETGKLVKAATWAAPAKLTDGSLQSKYDLTTELAEAVQDADRHGAFLYIR